MIKKFLSGNCYDSYKYFGAHPLNDGFIFRVYAPYAKKVQIIGDFNNYNGDNHEMVKINDWGVYELFIKGFKEYDTYCYKILTHYDAWNVKADPYAFYSELRPNFKSKAYKLKSYQFKDSAWRKNRTKCETAPLNIYEVHLGSFMRKEDGSFCNYKEIAKKLLSYVKEHHFTHVEFMPLMEHPFDGSWGYQVGQYYSITSRYGTPNELKYLINYLHNHNIGVIIDFVPTHFAVDDFSLINFDGCCIYEAYNNEDKYSQWGTLLFNYKNPIVRSFLLSCAYFYIEEYHFDGIRFDAVANMLYKDGNYQNGEQVDNINWMKMTNEIIHEHFPTVMMIAEDSTAHSGVTRPVSEGGIGFDYKWDLGWMNDTLKFMKEDQYHRQFHLNLINFSMHYFYSERFLLPLSHDEVVHLKGSIINKINGTYDQKFMQLRTLYTYMFMHPGKKLNFMGNELASFDEWNENKALYTDILNFEWHYKFNRFFKDLSNIYVTEPTLYSYEYDPINFKWIAMNQDNCVYIFERTFYDNSFIVFLNFKLIDYNEYIIKVNKKKGYYVEILNSDDDKYHGSNYFLNKEKIKIAKDQTIKIKAVAYAAIILKYIEE